ncbi:hypothetical protein C1752_08646 [Acaryochloris thomasi RCC1774]|uniref:Uncharacterized protein n=1 Tax=Acaryochloris thomasi RCC1774 TaxID=1764569 RepID=A0A2W1J9T8_9CYAN|nr:hypothetical protein [Acaryochloris thomasi]PZD70989.1 hypothetical protein C1752_08646 [Acaryochloris thomasi RCC1774]
MNNPITRLVLLGFLLCLTISPFAGLAPLMIILLVASVAWMLGIVQRIILGQPTREKVKG